MVLEAFSGAVMAVFLGMETGALLPKNVAIAPLSLAQNSVGEVQQLFEQGNQHLNRGQFSAALAIFEEALQRVRAAGPHPAEGVILNEIGRVRAHLGFGFNL